jgi:hypothetical protein
MIEVIYSGEIKKPVFYYPKIMIDKNDGEIVIFLEPRIGVSLDSDTFKPRTDWDMSLFADYSGEVTLRNTAVAQ